MTEATSDAAGPLRQRLGPSCTPVPHGGSEAKGWLLSGGDQSIGVPLPSEATAATSVTAPVAPTLRRVSSSGLPSPAAAEAQDRLRRWWQAAGGCAAPTDPPPPDPNTSVESTAAATVALGGPDGGQGGGGRHSVEAGTMAVAVGGSEGLQKPPAAVARLSVDVTEPLDPKVGIHHHWDPAGKMIRGSIVFF